MSDDRRFAFGQDTNRLIGEILECMGIGDRGEVLSLSLELDACEVARVTVRYAMDVETLEGIVRVIRKHELTPSLVAEEVEV